MSIEERFWSKVNITCLSGCWLWKASRTTQGYGQVQVRGKVRRAHRVAYELLVGPIPTGLHVLHSCDTPACVNPYHLSVGSNADNQRQKALRGRWSAQSGRQHSLSPREIEEVYSLLGYVTQEKLALLYNVTQGTISRMKRMPELYR